MSSCRRFRIAWLVWVTSVAVVLAQAVWPLAAIAMVPCNMAGMGVNAPMMGMAAPVLCRAACTGQDYLLDRGVNADHSSSPAPPYEQPVVVDSNNSPVVSRQAMLLHAQGPPFRILFCRLLN